jgi:hypothetical protein
MIIANTGLFQRLKELLQQLNALPLHNTSECSLKWTGHRVWECAAEDDRKGSFYSNKKINFQTAADLHHFWLKLVVSAVVCYFIVMIGDSAMAVYYSSLL